MIELDGRTPSGTHVVVERFDGHPLNVRIEIDGADVSIAERPTLLRDGGTRIFRTSRGTLTFPHRLGDDDRTPRFNGESVT